MLLRRNYDEMLSSSTNDDKYFNANATKTTHIELSRRCGDVGGAAAELLSEAVGERQQEAHGQDPGAEPFGLLGLFLLLLEEQFLQEGSA